MQCLDMTNECYLNGTESEVPAVSGVVSVAYRCIYINCSYTWSAALLELGSYKYCKSSNVN